MHQLRIYTLADSQSARTYVDVHWKRHIKSLEKFGITTENVFIEHETDAASARRVFALVSYVAGVDPVKADKEYMASPLFQADMQGFQMEKIIKVESTIITQAYTN